MKTETLISDPAVDAWRRVGEAGTDDVAYLAAIEDFERAIPTTLRGVILKRQLERRRAEALAAGDMLTWSGRIHFHWYQRTLDDGLVHIARQTKLGR